MLEDLHVTRAVHRLQREDAVVGFLVFRVREGIGRLHREHVLLVPAPVTGGFPERGIENLRGVDLFIGAGKAATHVGGERLEHPPALAVPEDDTRAFFLEMEQVHFAAKLAVVALFGFRQHVQVVVEIRLLGPGRAVDAREHRVVAVATPIGAGNLHQLEGRTDLAGGGHVRAAAEVEPFALIVDLQILSFRDRVDELDLVAFALGGEDFLGLFARPDLLGEGSVARNDFLHLLFDLRQIVRREGLVLGEVVIEAVLDHRADRDLRAGPELLHGFGHDVGRVVADELERAGIGAGDDLDRAVDDGIGKVAHGAVDRDGDGLLGKRLGNGFSDILAGCASVVAAHGTIGECQGNGLGHFRLLLVQSRQRMRVVAMTRFRSRIRRRLIPGFAVAVKEKRV